MRFLWLLFAACSLSAESPALTVWNELTAKRAALSSLHLEYQVEVNMEFKESRKNRSSQLTIDMAGTSWKEETVSEGYPTERYSDGKQVWIVRRMLGEHRIIKPKDGQAPPAPYIFQVDHLDWEHAKRPAEQPCASPQFPGNCVLLDVPYKDWNAYRVRSANSRIRKGYARIFAEKESGIVLSLRTLELIDHTQMSYREDYTYTLRGIQRKPNLDQASLHPRLEGNKQVRSFTEWDAQLINRLLAGKLAPEIEMRDLSGAKVRLSSLRGQVVLLDFWISWCTPCQVDAPSLDKLHAKFGDKGLQILGISVGENREVVQSFLKRFPHRFPILLTEENSLAAPYWPGAFPTYIVINKEGQIVRALEGREGFVGLKAALREAGLQTQ